MDIGFVMQEVASPTNCMLSCITGYGNSSVSELCCTATDTQRDANIRNLMLLPNIFCGIIFAYGVFAMGFLLGYFSRFPGIGCFCYGQLQLSMARQKKKV